MDEHRKLLELAASGGLPSSISRSGEISVDVFRDLFEAGYVSAVEAHSFSGRAYLEPRITLAGRQFLAQRAASGDTNISSHGQSGGITAHTVNVNARLQPQADARQPWWKTWWGIVGGLLGAAAAIVAILEFFDIKP
jgi:hypothetical protein